MATEGETIERYFESFLNFPRLVGTFPLNSRYQVTLIRSGYSLTVLGLLIILTVLDLMNPPFGEETLNVAYRSAVQAERFGMFLNSGVCTLWWIFKWKNFSQLVHGISDIGTKMENCELYSSIKAPKLCIIFCFVSVIVSIIGICDNTENMISWTSAAIVTSLILSTIQQYLGVIKIISVIIRCLRVDEGELMTSVVILHDASKCLKKADQMFGPLLLLTTLSAFSSFVSSLCFTLSEYTPSLSLRLLSLFFICYRLTPPLLVINSTNEALAEIRRYNETLFWRMVEDKTGMLLNKEKLNFHFGSQREVEFTACGFFRLNNSLIFSMISAATTYLVIVLQYGK